MANIIIITGPQAVGKMTVAEKLKEKIGYSLMTNHDSIELSIKIFKNRSSEQREFSERIRQSAFDAAVNNNVNMIFTYVTAFDCQDDIDYLNNIKNKFEKSGGKFYFVELNASLAVRLERNVTPHRLESKLSKNDIEWSNKDLIESMEKYRLNSNNDELLFPNHIKINNDNLDPDIVADMIISKFNLS